MLVLTLATMIAIALPAATRSTGWSTGTVVKLGTLFAEKQILFDRYRGLEALMREVSLAETVARAPVILDWAEDETRSREGAARPGRARALPAVLQRPQLFRRAGQDRELLFQRQGQHTTRTTRLRYAVSAGQSAGCLVLQDARARLRLPSQRQPRRQPRRHQGLDQLPDPEGRRGARHHRHRRRSHPVHPRGRRVPADRACRACSSICRARCRRIAIRAWSISAA